VAWSAAVDIARETPVKGFSNTATGTWTILSRPPI